MYFFIFQTIVYEELWVVRRQEALSMKSPVGNALLKLTEECMEEDPLSSFIDLVQQAFFKQMTLSLESERLP